MIKILFYSLLFWMGADFVAAQPIKQNLPFSDVPEPSEKVTSISTLDFRYQAQEQTSSFRPVQLMQTKPGVAFLSSAVIPGLGQAVNQKWLRAGIYFIADALMLVTHLNSQNKAEELERQYEKFANNHWSVVTYAQWLVEYHEYNSEIDNEYIDELAQQVQGETPTYNPQTDWNIVEIELLRNVERNTPYISAAGQGNTFTHVMPSYGSQQYYELISKYYQYGPGWDDFGTTKAGEMLNKRYVLAWNGSDMSPYFFEGADLADRFNDKYRLAGNMLSFILLNHVVSAFDAFITVKLKNNRLEAETSIFSPNTFTLKYHF